MRAIHAILLLFAAALIFPQLTWSQGQGPGQGRGGPRVPDFDTLARGKDVIVVAELPQMMQSVITRRLGFTGTQITREEYKTLTDRFQSSNPGGPATRTPPDFDTLANGKDVIVVADLPPRVQQMLEQRLGFTGTQITRAEYKS